VKRQEKEWYDFEPKNKWETGVVAIHPVSWDFKKDYFYLDLDEVTLDPQHRSTQYPRDHSLSSCILLRVSSLSSVMLSPSTSSG